MNIATATDLVNALDQDVRAQAKKEEGDRHKREARAQLLLEVRGWVTQMVPELQMSLDSRPDLFQGLVTAEVSVAAIGEPTLVLMRTDHSHVLFSFRDHRDGLNLFTSYSCTIGYTQLGSPLCVEPPSLENVKSAVYIALKSYLEHHKVMYGRQQASNPS